MQLEVMDARQIDFDRPEPGAETRRGQPGTKQRVASPASWHAGGVDDTDSATLMANVATTSREKRVQMPPMCGGMKSVAWTYLASVALAK